MAPGQTLTIQPIGSSCLLRKVLDILPESESATDGPPEAPRDALRQREETLKMLKVGWGGRREAISKYAKVSKGFGA